MRNAASAIDFRLSLSNPCQDLNFFLDPLKSGILGELADSFQYDLLGAHGINLACPNGFGNWCV